jgi:hypothetical protein
MKSKSPCYEFSSGINGRPVPLDSLRLEVNPACFFLLSYHHIDFAKFESAKEKDLLTIRFLNCEVKIAGRNLRDLALGLQERAVEFIKPLPARYGVVAEAEGGGVVESLEVEAVKAE